jgi:ATP-dependent protease ClpP protease subunit/FtsZ-binding cell division protein ZapB
MKIAKLNIEGYIGELDSAFAGEKSFTLNNLKDFLASLDSDVTDIHYKVNSGGGSVYEGWDIHTALLASGKNLTAIGENIVGSIATVIFLAPKPENRKLIKNTKFFVHNPYWLPEQSEPMRANELLALGKDLKGEQDKILNFYAKESKATAYELAPYLEKETDLTAENAVKMGFANEVIDALEEVEYRQYRLVAMIKPNKTNETMSKVDETILNKMNKFFKNFSRVTKGKFFDMDLAVTNESGEAVNLFIESDSEDITGANVFEVDAEGNQSPAKPGKYMDAEGKTVVVTDGKVSEVIEKVIEDAAQPTVEELKAKLEAANTELNALKASKEVLETENDAIKANITVIENEFKALKEVVIGEGAEFDLGTQSFKARKTITSNPNQAYLDEMASIFKKK